MRRFALALAGLMLAGCSAPCVPALAALALAGCSALQVQPGPAPAPQPGFQPRVVLHADGSGDYQTFVGTVPFSAAFRWKGNGTIEARLEVTGVVVYASGDSTWSVTPVAGLESELEGDVAAGRLVILRQGVRVGLTPPPAP